MSEVPLYDDTRFDRSRQTIQPVFERANTSESRHSYGLKYLFVQGTVPLTGQERSENCEVLPMSHRIYHVVNERGWAQPLWIV